MTRGERVLVGRSKAKRPAWIAGLVRAGLVDSPADVPEHTWLDTPVQALASIYEPRAALDRGFVWYGIKIRNDTKSPIADFARMAEAPKEALKGLRFPLDGDADDFEELLAKVNARLAALGLPRRIYEVATGDAWYAFIARAPKELAIAEVAGLTVQAPSASLMPLAAAVRTTRSTSAAVSKSSLDDDTSVQHQKVGPAVVSQMSVCLRGRAPYRDRHRRPSRAPSRDRAWPDFPTR